MGRRSAAVLDTMAEWVKRVVAGTPGERIGRRAYRQLRRWMAPESLAHRYDRLTFEVLDRCLAPDSNTIDVGCNRGLVLREILTRAPRGRHFAFEPIPLLYQRLTALFPTAEISPLAISDTRGRTTFHHVLSREAISGLRRQPAAAHEAVREIPVDTDRLDAVIPCDCPIRFIKIDVEGAELRVLRGAERLLHRWQPLVAFEFGLSQAPLYQATPATMAEFLTRCGLQISRLEDWLGGRPPLTVQQFSDRFYRNLDFFFLAHPPR